MLKFSEKEMRDMDKTSLALKDGSGYVGYLEAFHMLHCVVSDLPRKTYTQSSPKCMLPYKDDGRESPNNTC